MRREFHPILSEHMRKDDRIWVCTADLGYKMLDLIRDEFPNRFTNAGAAEQLMMATAIGLAHDGFLPVCYTITPFYWRCAEHIKTYLDYEGAVVKLVGAGRGNADHSQEDYQEDGQSHWAGGDRAFFSLFPRIRGFWPESVDNLPETVHDWLYHDGPSFLSLKR